MSSIDSSLLLLSARRCGVPTIGLQSLIYGRDDRLTAPPVDRYLCLDPFARNTLCEMTGFPRDRTSVIGSVRYDAVIGRARSYDRNAERQALGIAANQHLVVIATQPLSIEDNKRLVDLSLEALHSIPAARGVIKLHPKESDLRLTEYQREVEKWGLGDRIVVTKTHDIYRLLVAADLVVNMMSNVGLEAAILDRNVVAVEIDLDIDIFSLSDIGLVEVAHNREDTIFQIRRLLVDAEARAAAEARRRAFFENAPELRDGRTLDRLRSIIRETVALGSKGA